MRMILLHNRRWILLSLCVVALVAASTRLPGKLAQQPTQYNAIIFVAEPLLNEDLRLWSFV
jgi:hypothetical protein